MSKGNSDGDVIANRLSLVEAKGQRLLASLFASQPDSNSSNSAAKPQDEDEDLKQDYGHDRLGVGGILPKDIEDGSFTRRIPTSNDKLLEQLIGKKKAKAHIAAKQEAARPNAKTQRYGRQTVVKKEDSEDEEEGRAAAFKSKRSKKISSKPVVVRNDESGDENEDEESRAQRLSGAGSNKTLEDATADMQVNDKQPKEADEVEGAEEVRSVPKKRKAKPASFLDELLAERSKKKNKKKGAAEA